jgi:long-chain fatty acid transport protein
MKKVILVLFAFAVSGFASVIGLDALGEEQVAGGMASTAGRGYAGGAKTGDAEGLSVLNPARNAFDTKVVFNVNFLIEMVSLENHGDNFGLNNITMPSFNLSFPMGGFGAMGLSLWQSYASNLNEEVSEGKNSVETTIEYQSSVYEIVPSYTFRLPVIRNFSVGASAHVVMGNSMRKVSMGPNTEGLSSEDTWAVSNAEISDYVDGTWEIKNHPAYYTAALQYRGHQSSFYFSYTTPHTLLNELDYNFRMSELDTLAPTKKSREIDVPAMLAAGMNFRFMKRNNVMFDIAARGWDKDIENIGGSFNMESVTETQKDLLVAFGLQRDGSPMFYDPYLDRITYRLGGWYKTWYVKNVYELGGSLGAGFPLGRKGTTLDLSFQGGKRFADSGRGWDEIFLGFRIGLMGVGNWGQTR